MVVEGGRRTQHHDAILEQGIQLGSNQATTWLEKAVIGLEVHAVTSSEIHMHERLPFL